MRFVLTMAVRETRASWRRLLFFFVCIAVGVAAIVTLRSLIQNIRGVFGQEAKALIAADVLIATNRPWTPASQRVMDGVMAGGEGITRTETIEMPTMVRPVDETRSVARTVELRAVGPDFPLYGAIRLDGGQAYSHALLRNRGALLRPEVLTALGLSVGDQILIGDAPFDIRGVILNEPGRRIGSFSLGPRVMIDTADVPPDLVGSGSLVRRVVHVRAPEERVDPLVAALDEGLKGEFLSIRSYRARDDEVGRNFERAENYLSLVGLVVVVLGGIAVSSVTRVFVLQKLRGIAVLKCVGASSRQIISVYLIQVMALGVAGSLFGVAMAFGAVRALSAVVGDATPFVPETQYGLTTSAVVQGLGIGVLVAFLFAIVPLLQVRLVRPSLLLRDESHRRRRPDLVRAGAVVIVSAAIVAVTAWQASSLRIGLSASVGFGVLAAVLQGAGRLLVRALAPLANAASFPLRHAVLHLSRPGNQTRVVLLAVGLAAFFIVGVRSLQASLLEDFEVGISQGAPDMFLIDIHRDQLDGLRELLEDPEQGVQGFQILPAMRARVTGVVGSETRLESFEDVRANGALSREYTVTYRNELAENERIVDGEFWTGPASEPEVSVEKGLHDRSRINIGDTVRFDVLGRVISARVSSIREVDWRDSRAGGFMFVFRPGPLDNAPHMFIAPVSGPEGDAARTAFQHALAQRFPNVSAIDLREILVTVRDAMSKVTLAISVVGGLLLLSGALILVGAVAMTKFQRVYEAAVFRTLGANTRTIAQMLLLEYGVLGILAGTVGSVGAMGLTWGVSRYALEMPWRVFAGEHVVGIALTTALVAGIGVASSLDVLRRKPLGTLRAE